MVQQKKNNAGKSELVTRDAVFSFTLCGDVSASIFIVGKRKICVGFGKN